MLLLSGRDRQRALQRLWTAPAAKVVLDAVCLTSWTLIHRCTICCLSSVEYVFTQTLPSARVSTRVHKGSELGAACCLYLLRDVALHTSAAADVCCKGLPRAVVLHRPWQQLSSRNRARQLAFFQEQASELDFSVGALSGESWRTQLHALRNLLTEALPREPYFASTVQW